MPEAPDVRERSELESLEAFHEMLESLPESQREVILLLKGSGMSLQEVARATSLSVGAVKQKAHRAYEKLRLLLERGKGNTGESQDRLHAR